MGNHSFSTKWSQLRWYFDRTFSEKSISQLIWLVGIIAGVFFLMLIISSPISDSTFEKGTVSMTRSERIVSLLINPGSISEVDPKIRYFAIGVAIIGIIVLSGFLITVLSNMLERHVEHFRNGDIHYKLNGHTIVIGYNSYTVSLLKALLLDCAKEEKILLVSAVRSSFLREHIETEFNPKERKNIVYYSEDCRSRKSIELLDTDRAERIYLLGDEENNNDSYNISCLNHILSINKERKSNSIPCYLFLADSATNFLIKQQGLPKEWDEYLNVTPINIAENWAKKIFVYKGKDSKYPEIPLVNTNKHNRLVVIGMSNWGIELAEVFARLSHFCTDGTNNESDLHSHIGKTTITFIDDDIYKKMEKFCGTFPAYFEIQKSCYIKTDSKQNNEIIEITGCDDFLDVNFEFIDGSIYNQIIQQRISAYAKDKPFIAFTQEDDANNVEGSIHLPDIVYKLELPIFVKQQYSNIVDTIINLSHYENLRQNSQFQKYKSIIPFGMIDDYDILVNNDDWMYYYFRKMNEDIYGAAWDSKYLPINKYIDILYHAYYIHLFWRQLRNKYDDDYILWFIHKNADILSEVEHLRWGANKLMSGYTTGDDGYFSSKMIAPYDTLSEEIKQYDYCIIEYIEFLIKHYNKTPGLFSEEWVNELNAKSYESRMLRRYFFQRYNTNTIDK